MLGSIQTLGADVIDSSSPAWFEPWLPCQLDLQLHAESLAKLGCSMVLPSLPVRFPIAFANWFVPSCSCYPTFDICVGKGEDARL